MSTQSVVLVTGGTSGIGEATVHQFARAGWRVAFTGRRADRGSAIQTTLRSTGLDALYIQADAAKEADAQRAVAETMARFGRLDAALNNAGIEGEVMKQTHEQNEENFQRVMAINVGGVLWAMKHEIPAMLKNGGGSIINLSSVGGTIGMAGMGVYVASKHAVEGLTKAAALEYARQGIRVNAVGPAAIATEMVDRFVGVGETDFRKGLAAMHPIGRLGTVDEVAAAVVFLASKQASFITGQTIYVDGGWLAQ
jgi:NAD(P)-dependent dehydrogenase (short-subunit alcohol dehydrogenase family)